MDDLNRRIRMRIDAVPALRASVVARVVGGSDVASIAPDAVYHSASTMKLPVLVELYRRGAAGSLALDATLTVTADFWSIADGSAYTLLPADDSERRLYARLGEAVTMRELARLMITESSNVAANMLVDVLGAAAISATMVDVGAPSLRVLRGVEDGPAHAVGLDSTVTAAGLASLLEGLALGQVVSPAASAEMISILAGQAFNHGIPAGLPAGTRVAHKTGSITRLFHDAALVLDGAGAPWILVVLTQGLEEEAEAPALVAAIARDVHRDLVGRAMRR